MHLHKELLADSDDITEVTNFTQSNYAEPNPAYFGAGKGMNVIYFHLESIQNFSLITSYMEKKLLHF